MAALQQKITCDILCPKLITKLSVSGSNSVVECQLPKLDVAGSSPVSRSKIIIPKPSRRENTELTEITEQTEKILLFPFVPLFPLVPYSLFGLVYSPFAAMCLTRSRTRHE